MALTTLFPSWVPHRAHTRSPDSALAGAAMMKVSGMNGASAASRDPPSPGFENLHDDPCPCYGDSRYGSPLEYGGRNLSPADGKGQMSRPLSAMSRTGPRPVV